MFRHTFLFLCVVITTCCFAQESDSIFLHNGQILIGEIKSAKLGIITIDDRDLKIINVKAYKIKHLNAPGSMFRIETDSKRIFYSSLQKTEQPGHVAVTNKDEVVILSFDDIAFLTPLKNNFFKRLSGNFGLGFSYSKSSGIGQINTNATIYYAAKKMQYQLTANLISSIDSSSFSRDNENVQLFAAYDLQHAWFLASQFNYQRNLELGLARRFQELIGAGNKLLLKDHWQIWAISGLSLGQEKSTDAVQLVTLEVPVMFRINFFQYQKVNMQINANQAMYVSLTQAGRIRYDGNINFAYEIIHNFNLNINLYTNYDSRPPDQSSNNFDYGTTLSVNYKF